MRLLMMSISDLLYTYGSSLICEVYNLPLTTTATHYGDNPDKALTIKRAMEKKCVRL